MLYAILYLMFTEQMLAWDFHKGCGCCAPSAARPVDLRAACSAREESLRPASRPVYPGGSQALRGNPS